MINISQIFNSWQTIRPPWFDVVGDISVIALFITYFAIFLAWLRGILPPLWRLGIGLRKRKITVFAKSDSYRELTKLLADSGVFNVKNINQVASVSNLGSSEVSTLFLVYWPDWKDDFEKILDKKADGTGMLVYSPYKSKDKVIPEEIMEKIDSHRNTSVANFRGRLLNDLVAIMMTTGFKKK